MFGICEVGGGGSLDLARCGGGGSSYSSWVCMTHGRFVVVVIDDVWNRVYFVGRFSTRCVEDSCIAAGCG